MTVYVVERDVYNSRNIQGVYATLEAAQASVERVKEWTLTDSYGQRSWWNGLDFGACADIWEMEVQS